MNTTTVAIRKSTNDRIDRELGKHFQPKPSKQEFVNWLINKYFDGALIDIEQIRQRNPEPEPEKV